MGQSKQKRNKPQPPQLTHVKLKAQVCRETGKLLELEAQISELKKDHDAVRRAQLTAMRNLTSFESQFEPEEIAAWYEGFGGEVETLTRRDKEEDEEPEKVIPLTKNAKSER